ncbi:hypothetical protein JW964_27265 [candidate division KSB1 bacterium]|nr:hypothetical protein [candidate division KSB1 bacterium]
MAMKSIHYKFKKINISPLIQANILKSVYSNSHIIYVNHIKLIWEITLQPTPLSQEYLIRMTYKSTNRPYVKIIEPELQSYNNEKIPHLFSDGSLCLFRYKYNEWNPSMRIADTIIPWTALWLYYFEIWCVTGIWYGGGEHPKSKNG